jgi:hypothetical protein
VKTMDNSTPARARPSAAALHALVEAELSTRARIGHVALLLAALGGAAVVGTLWATEPGLAAHTRVAFAALVGICISWSVYAIWVLTHRHVFFARHRIVAGRMGVAFSALFAVGMLWLGYVGRPGAYNAAGVGVVMLSAAIVILVRAHRRFARLTERRNQLARETQEIREGR